MKNKMFIAGMLSILLVFGFVLASCSNDTTDNTTSSFDGSTLAGTKWAMEDSISLEELMPGLGFTMEATIEFTSGTEGKSTAKITKWTGSWSSEMKTKFEGLASSGNGPFTYTYDATTKKGKATGAQGGEFVVNVEKRELTIESENPISEEPETAIFKLR
jgi:hypothetical protein